MGAFYRQLINKWGVQLNHRSPTERIGLFCLTILLVGLIVGLIVLSWQKNPIAAAMGIIMFASGVYLLMQERINQQHRSMGLFPSQPFAVVPDNHGDLGVRDANIMDNLDRSRADMTAHIQPSSEGEYIIIQNQRVRVDGNVSHLLERLRDIFEQTIAKSLDPVAAINEFARDLTEQFYKHPELKSYFYLDPGYRESELVNQIIKFVLSPPPYPLEKIDENGDLVRIEYHDDRDAQIDKCIVIYKGYRINLYRNQNNRWVFRIQKRDLSPLELKRQPRRYRKKENAIAKAKKHIRADLFQRWLF